MKQVLFSPAKGCNCRAWELDFSIKVLHPEEEGEVCIKNERIRIGKRGTGNKERGREKVNGEQETDNSQQRTGI